MHRVFVLGAGASQDANIPLTNQIIPNLLREKPDVREEPLRTSTVSLDILIRYLKQIKINEYLSLLDIEDLLSLTYFPIVFKEIINWDEREIDSFRRHLVWGVLYTIENGLNNWKNIETYRLFAKMVEETDSIISFNYDLVFEKFLLDKFGAINYHLDSNLISENGRLFNFTSDNFTFLKLHGSMNLFYCDRCNKYTIMEYPYATISEDPNLHLANENIPCPEDDGGNLIAVIIPPGGEKSQIAPILQPSWKSAYQVLKKAEEIVFIGISLRENDIWLRYLIQSSIINNKNVKLKYICKKITPQNKERIQNILLTNKIEFFDGGFAKWINDIYGLPRFF